jgi:pimeloyl-ACP methyl ester carboxylesterase
MTDVLLVPGFWLRAGSWDQVLPPLLAAGLRPLAITLPGLESVDADRSGIGLRTHIDALVDLIDRSDAPVVLVGHSGAGAVVHGAVDARPDRVTRAVYVDSWPTTNGGSVNTELATDGPDVPLPQWDVFDDEDLVDLTDELRDAFRASAVPTPKGAAYDALELTDERRWDVPVTIVACEFTEAQLDGWLEGGAPWLAEVAKLRDLTVAELPTGHWPQFTRPADLGTLLAEAVTAG